MTRPSLADLKTRFRDKTEKKFTASASKVEREKLFYPFWTLELGQESHFRILEDKDETNDNAFFREKLVHNLIDKDANKKTLSCMTNWDEPCPSCIKSFELFKANDKTSLKYYAQTKWIIAIHIVKSGFEPETYNGQTLYLSAGKQIFNVIRDQVKTLDDDDKPFDFANGVDFILRKTAQGEFANYSTSTFARKPSTISAVPLLDLKAGLGDKPNVVWFDQYVKEQQ